MGRRSAYRRGVAMLRRWPWRLRALIAAPALALTLAFAVAAGSVATATPAEARPKYAALVLDKYSGRVLFSRNADSYRYPASLTKIMTLYVVFEELAAGNITLDTKWPVSKYAAGQAPSKLGLDPGDTITVENAILALVTKSANDVAVVVAEGISGTERKFAQRMTSTARNLGMARTTFRNPHGLPDRRQVTTARDMATLAQRVMDDFPQYYGYFGTESFNFRGRVFNNHNNLLGDYDGTNGIKTGYTRASGFNLTASVIRDGKHLVGVVLGGKTPRARDSHMVDILDQAFAKVPQRGHLSIATSAPIPRSRPETRAQAVLAARAPLQPQAERQVIAMAAAPATAIAADLAPAPAPNPAPAPETPRLDVAALTPAPAPAPAPAPSFADVSEWLVPAARAHGGAPGATDTPRGAGDISDPGAPVPAETRAASLRGPQTPPAPDPAAWRIQIGAYSDAEEAGRRIQAAMSRAGSALRGKGPATVPVKTASRTLYRARFTGFSGEDNARDACATLIREGISCITVPPDDWYAPAN